MKETWKKIKDIVYIIGLLGLLTGWIVDHRVTKFKNEMKEKQQDSKIQAQADEISSLKQTSTKNKDYAEENATNILWIVRVLELDSD